MRPKHLFLITLLAVFFVSCNKKKSQPLNFDYGKVENNVYSNSFFKFSIQIPPIWETLTQEQNQNLMDVESADKKADVEHTSVNLLTVLQNDYENSGADFFANLSIIAENLKGSDRVKNGTDYLMLTRIALDDTGIKREYPDRGTVIETINGIEFSTMRVNTVDPSLKFSQKFYTTIINGYALTFIESFGDENQQIELNKIIQTLKITE